MSERRIPYGGGLPPALTRDLTQIHNSQVMSAALEIERLETSAAELRRVLLALLTELDSTALTDVLWPELRRVAKEARGVVGR